MVLVPQVLHTERLANLAGGACEDGEMFSVDCMRVTLAIRFETEGLELMRCQCVKPWVTGVSLFY